MRVIVDKVSKKFKKGVKGKNTLSKVLSFVSGRIPSENFWALKNVSFNVKEGENLGVIGANGSGKTTLLRTIAGIYRPTEGEIKTNGRMVCLSNLSNGLKSRLSVKENVFLVGTIFGLNKKEINEIFSEIIEFAGLEDFVYSKTHQLSGGMKKRIAFSITMHCVKHLNPNILLLDEVFSGGGDEEFKERALDKVEKLIKGGKSIILASHKMRIIKKYCNKVEWMHRGEIVEQGSPETVITDYLESVGRKNKSKQQDVKKNKTENQR